MSDYVDQTCTRCNAKVTAKELRKGASQHYGFILLNLYRSQFQQMLLCTLCQVNQEKFYKMEPLLPETKS